MLTTAFGRARMLAATLIAVIATATTAPGDPGYPPPAELTKVTKEPVALGVPSAWKEATLPGATDVLGMWSPEGKGIFDPSAFILLGKTDSTEMKIDPKETTVLSDAEVTIGGQTARKVAIQSKGGGGAGGLPVLAGGRAVGILFKKAGADGKYLVIVLAGRSDQWDTLGPLFDRVIASITIDGVGTTPPGGFVTAVYLDKGVEKPLEGATVLVGWRLHLFPFASVPSGEFWEDVLSRAPPGPRSGSIDLLAGEALFLTGTTAANGIFAPNLPPGTYDVVVWKAGHVPQMNARVTVPGGGFKAYVNPDTQVGATDRHRTLDTSRVFKMDPPKPNRPVVWGRVTLGTPRSPSSSPPSPAAGEEVTIVVGENLSFIRKEDPRSPGVSVDVVQGDVIYAEVKTNKDGTYAIPLPLGAYSMIVWKQGYIPEERNHVDVWPGDYFCKLIKDEQPGGTSRHQVLDTTSQNIPRKKLDDRPGIRGVVKVSDRGVRKPAEGVTVLVGRGLRLDHPIIPDPTDKVLGTMLLARAETNRDGEFFVPVPAGTYHLIVWKAGCIPQEFDPVTVPPGVHNVTLIRDNQPGSSGRHQKLDTSGVPVPPRSPEDPAPLVSLLPFVLGAPQTLDLVQRTVGDVTLSVPADWRKDTDAPADEGAWLIGKPDRPDAFFAVLRDISFDGLVEAFDQPARAEVKIDGRAGISYTGRLKDEAGMKATLVVLAAAGKDGRRVALLAKAPEGEWAKHAPTFDAILSSVKLPGATTTPPAPPIPPEEGLKELTRVSRIPDFKADISYTAYEDRVVLQTGTGTSAVLGVAGQGKVVGPTFRPFLDMEKSIAGLLGEAVSLELRTLGGTVVIQMFEGGALVQEKATGVVWWNAHPKRPRNLRPTDEITRYPRVVFGGVQYAVAVYPDRVQFEDVIARKSMAVKVGQPGQAIPEAFRTVVDRDKLDAPFGGAVSGEVPLFDTAGRVQAYEGGVLIVEPGTNRFWWCTLPKRGGTPPKPVLALPKDPNAVVIRVDYVGGYTPPRKTNIPYLEIRADGRVTLIDPFGRLPTIQAKLTPDNVLEFLKFAIDENGFFDLDTKAIDQTIRLEGQKRKLPTITDLPTTVIVIRIADRTHEVRCYAPEFYAEQLPDVKSVKQFQAIHARLTRYMEKLRGEKNPL